MKTTLIFTVISILVLGGFAYASAFDINTPISHWTLDETSGATVNDSADSHNGTIAGNPVWTTGKIDGCLDFDGSEDYVDFGDVGQFEFSDNDFTISFWFKTEGEHDAESIMAKYDIYAGRQWLFQQTSDNKINFATYYVDSSTGGESLVSTEGYIDEWTHVTAVRDGSAKYLYINGALNNTGTCQGIVEGTTSPVLIGAISASASHYQFFNGKIDDVRIYDYALSANEAYQLYQIPEPASAMILAIGMFLIASRKK